MTKIATMTVWNVQLGLAVHVKAPNGKFIVIDLGTGSVQCGTASPLSKLRYENIAYMIITHPHLDHIDDILHFEDNPPAILHRATSLTNYEVMQGVRLCDRAKFEKYCEINDRFNGSVEPTNANNIDNSLNYGGLSIQTFSTSSCDHSNYNNFSTITVFVLSGVKIVVCGDNEKESLDILMAHEDFKQAVKDADVLVAPHHGRESAYHHNFVSLVNPRITIISDTNKVPTSASSKYTSMSRGWYVNKADGTQEVRKCLTTRNDGSIKIEFGESIDNRYYGLLSIQKEM